MKKILKWLLLSYLTVTAFVIISQEFPVSNKCDYLIWSQTPKISVMYFFGTKRCSMCKNMEMWANEITQNISHSKTLPPIEFRTIPWQDKKSKSYVDHYKLLGNALIISYADERREVARKDLIDIWPVAHDEKRYKKYVMVEFQKFITQITSKNLPLSSFDGGRK